MPPRHSSTRLTRLLSVFVLAGLVAGCAAESPRHSFSTQSQWRQTAPDSYTNIHSGQTINRDQYSLLVAREVYAHLAARPGSDNFLCR